MVKRTHKFENEKEDTAPERKRSRSDDNPSINDVPITTATGLKALLAFNQDDIAQYRLDLQRFRRYLEGIPSSDRFKELEDSPLLEYLCGSRIITSTDQIEVIPDILQAWRYAVSVHDEGLMPTIPAILALLIKKISSSPEFVDIGIQMCKTVMQKENMMLFQKSMNSPRTRDSTIARCLDLLTQIVRFDGGACAKSVWLQKSVSLSRLHQMMATSKKSIYSSSGPTSVRDHTISFLLANLRYQDQEAKAEILSNRKSTQNMLKELLSEPTSVIVEVLSTLKLHVVEDTNLGRSAKGHLLTDGNLGYILAVTRQTEGGDEWNSIRDLAERFLTESCTSRLLGIVYRQNGWYPPGTEDVTLREDILFVGSITAGTDSSKYKDRVPVRNTTLASFIQDLKPWASLSERKLILGIFTAAPELVADYFIRKKAFSFEPKLTTTWIGWASFIYSVVRLQCPAHETYLEGRIRQPPPIVVILQNILPQPLTLQSLNKALKQPSELIKVFAIRILIAAFRKVQEVLTLFQTASAPSIWQATGIELQNMFQTRCPEYKQVLNLYQNTSKDKHILREALSSLLVLYHNITPEVVHSHKFDVSFQITKTLDQVVEKGDNCDAFALLELENLLKIGHYVVEAKWWQKSENTTLTMVTTMLRLLSSARLRENKTLKKLVRGILEENFVLHIDEKVDSLSALLKSLADMNSSLYNEVIYTYLDDCLLRLVRKPIKYHGDIQDLIKEGAVEGSISPASMVLFEQWPFFQKAHTSEESIACAKWLCSYFIYSVHAGQSLAQVQAICKQFLQATEHKDSRHLFKECKSMLKQEKQVAISREVAAIRDVVDVSLESSKEVKSDLAAALDSRLILAEESRDYPELTKWQTKQVFEAIVEGDIESLIRCITSTYEEIRIQAVTAMKLCMKKVQSSTYEERQSVHLLLGILQETISQHGTASAIPTIAISLAARSVPVLNNPLHVMYTKVNQFLSRAPIWDLAKLPSYWMDRIFHKPPTQLEFHWKEVNWLLDTLLDGLRNVNVSLLAF